MQSSMESQREVIRIRDVVRSESHTATIMNNYLLRAVTPVHVVVVEQQVV